MRRREFGHQPSGADRLDRRAHGRCEVGDPDRAKRRKAERSERGRGRRSEEHTSELQSLMRISYAVFCLKKKNKTSVRLSASVSRVMIRTNNATLIANIQQQRKTPTKQTKTTHD